MKLRNILELLGYRTRTRHYGYTTKQFLLSDGDIINYAGWDHPREEPKEITEALINGYKKYIHPGDFCIDVGAHTGDTTLPMALAAGPMGCVLALEPNPFVYHVLEKNIRCNGGLTNIRSVMAAAAPESGFMRMEYSDAGFCNGGRHQNISSIQHGHFYRLEVYAINLEEELRSDFAQWLPKLKFIKIDAEGYDLTIIQSLAGVISEYHPILRTEVFKATSPEYRQELLQFLTSLDYSCFEVAAEPLLPGRRIRAAQDFTSKHVDIVAFPSSVSSL